MFRSARRVLLTLLTASALAAGAVGCTSEEKSGDGPGSQESEPPVETKARIGKVTGKLAADRREPVLRAVTELVDGWLDGAYGGEFPRSDFSDAFPGFTPKLAAKAETAPLMSHSGIGERIDGITVISRSVVADVFAADGTARGATAHVKMVYETSGEVRRHITLDGRLMLTKKKDSGWQVFAYDMTRDGRPLVEPEEES